MQVPKWTYVMCIAIGSLFFVIGGIEYYFTREPYSSAILPIIGVFLVTGFSIALARRLGDDRIERSGVAASAVVRAVASTHWVTNGVPNWRLDLRVNAEPPFDATIKILTYTPPVTGSLVGVRYDPAKPRRVVLADA